MYMQLVFVLRPVAEAPDQVQPLPPPPTIMRVTGPIERRGRTLLLLCRVLLLIVGLGYLFEGLMSCSPPTKSLLLGGSLVSAVLQIAPILEREVREASPMAGIVL